MTDIFIRPLELRQISEQLKSSAKKIDMALQTIDNDILSLKGDKFLGNRATVVQIHYAPKRDALLKAKEIVTYFAEDLQYAATRFEQADRRDRDGNLNILPETGGPLQVGSVLGASDIANTSTQKISDLIRSEKELREKFAQWMADHGKEIEGWDIEKIDKAMVDIRKQIADLKNGITDMKEITLSGWWKFFTNADEEYIDSSEKGITKLEGLLEKYEHRKELLTEKSSMETHIKDQKDLLTRTVTEGSIKDGSTPDWLRKSMGGCTQYVAEKRDVSDFNGGHPGNAVAWLDQAQKAGYDTGDLPQKGAIIYYKPGYDADGSGPRLPVGEAGHVGYVESVTRVEGGYEVKISQASTKYGSQYLDGWERGTHTTPTTASKFIPDSGVSGVSFIYDK